MSIERLRTIPVFAGLSDEQLSWLITHATVIEFTKGDKIMKNGQIADAMYVILKGTMQLIFSVNGQQSLGFVWSENDVTGLLPYSRMKTAPGDIVAVTPGRALRIGKEHFSEMLQMSPELGQRLVAIMTDRVREYTRNQQQREKMLSLGKLAAGLAHELNNPAAAACRDTAELKQRRARVPALMTKIVKRCLEPEQFQHAYALLEKVLQQQPLSDLSTFERSDREDELAACLEHYDVEESWVIAGTLVEAGLTTEDLDALADQIPKEAMPDIIAWIENAVATDQMLERIGSAVGRISDLVTAVKTYSHMDRSPDKQPTDVHEGLENTLIMLNYKLKRKAITLSRNYQEDLPTIPAYGGELNQVWTNLIDNAIDAMPDGGELRICTELEEPWIAVRIIDNGPGIPPESQARLFEPFFTTKEVGEGTGLGLDIVHRIVTRHQGDISVASEPGKTAFTVRLPLNTEKDE